MRTLKTIAALALFSAVLACPARAGEKIVALCMSHISNAFTIELSDAVKKRAGELGIRLIVNDGNQDARRQTGQIETLIAQGVDGFIVEAASVDGIRDAVEKAKKAGIPLVTVCQKVTNQDQAAGFVGASHERGGEIEMAAAAKALGGKGNIALILGPVGADAQLGRSAGYAKILGENPGMRVAFEESASWDEEIASELMAEWLQSGEPIDAVVAQNDGMALGAVKALEAAGRAGTIPVYGFDAGPEALAAVKEGRMAGTVSQNTALQGSRSVDVMAEVLEGKDVPPEVMVDLLLVDRSNVEQFL